MLRPIDVAAKDLNMLDMKSLLMKVVAHTYEARIHRLEELLDREEALAYRLRSDNRFMEATIDVLEGYLSYCTCQCQMRCPASLPGSQYPGSPSPSPSWRKEKD